MINKTAPKAPADEIQLSSNQSIKKWFDSSLELIANGYGTHIKEEPLLSGWQQVSLSRSTAELLLPQQQSLGISLLSLVRLTGFEMPWPKYTLK